METIKYNYKYDYFKDKDTFKEEFIRQVESMYAVSFSESNSYQRFIVLGQMVRQAVADDWRKSIEYVNNWNLKLKNSGVFLNQNSLLKNEVSTQNNIIYTL